MMAHSATAPITPPIQPASAPSNPPAFACVASGPTDDWHVQHGMDLRDWFAGQAMIGVAAYAGEPVPPELLAKAAYGFADAMLAERAKVTGQ